MHQVNDHMDGIKTVGNVLHCLELIIIAVVEFWYFGIHKESAKLLVPEWATAVLTLAVVIPFGQSFSLTCQLNYFFNYVCADQ